MDALAALASAGKLRQRIAQTLPLDQAAQAHELGESGRGRKDDPDTDGG
jgi:NADPH:quinone reductase-like Zn-dependent oxidoreductase